MVLTAEVRPVKEVKEWEDYISLGVEAREQKDNAEWLIGDLANQIVVDYGNDSIGKFSYAIGLVTKTVRNYKATAKHFPPLTRNKYPKLSFSHFRAVQGLTQPEAWLIKADDESWSVEMLAGEIKKAYDVEVPHDVEDIPPKVYRCPKCGHWRLENVSAFEVCKGHYEMEDGKEVYK